ncbi:MAG TPA: hypothetical protein VN843_09815 [Anaerolineales bacterium]|nr:hypothetical protein [Anaerolineales bacterium]
MSQATIQTFTGKMFDILNPTPDMICIEDIAHAGSQMNRFTGHCRFPYPVTQHEYLGSFIRPENCECASEQEHALKFLLHDASESYISDVNRPLKHFTDVGLEYRKVEKVIQDLVYVRYGLDPHEPPCVKTVDNWMLYAEKAQLMPTKEFAFEWSDDRKTADVIITERTFYQNKALYLSRFNKLCRPQDVFDWSTSTT